MNRPRERAEEKYGLRPIQCRAGECGKPGQVCFKLRGWLPKPMQNKLNRYLLDQFKQHLQYQGRRCCYLCTDHLAEARWVLVKAVLTKTKTPQKVAEAVVKQFIVQVLGFPEDLYETADEFAKHDL